MLGPAPLSPCQTTPSYPASTAPPSHPSITPYLTSRPSKTLTYRVTAAPSSSHTCSLSSFRRQTKPKKNRLRTKQLSRLVSPELPVPSLPQPRNPFLLDELAGRMSDEIPTDNPELVPLFDGKDSGVLATEDEHEGEELQTSLMESILMPGTVAGDAIHSSAAGITEVIAVPKLLMQISIYLGALLAVQTVCAILFFWREDFTTEDEALDERSRRKKMKGPFSWWDNVERKRDINLGGQVGQNDSALANKVAEIRAMANEARVTEANQTVRGVEGAVGITGGVKNEVSPRLKRPPKGAVPIAMHRNDSLKFDIADKTGKSNIRRKREIGRYRAALNRSTTRGFNGTEKKATGGVTTNTKEDERERTGRSVVDHGTADGGLKTSMVSQVSFADDSLTEKGEKADRNRHSSGEISVNNGGSENLQSHHRYWWLKLPYVLGIYLQRASGDKNYGGLYTLKINSYSENAIPVTIVFEDRTDATNLCYLLETYFEDLSDARADIVPIMTQELVGAMEGKSLNAAVIKKGQIRLYAGQLLSEVETQLKFIADQNLQQEIHEE